MIGNPTRPGDLAEIIRGGNAGRRVYVIDVCGYHFGDRLVKPLQPVHTDCPIGGYAGLHMEEGYCWDDFLRPLRDPPEDESIEHRENVGVEA